MADAVSPYKGSRIRVAYVFYYLKDRALRTYAKVFYFSVPKQE